MNTDFRKFNGARLIDNIHLIELKEDPALLGEIKKLLREYGNYMYGDLNLTAGKENFFKDLEHFPGDSFQPPSGTFVVAKSGDAVIGCVGIRKFERNTCEMKRMFIRPGYRGEGIGGFLCNFVMEWCRKSGYKMILLDTNLEMKEAVGLYYKCGFKEIEPYCINENNHPVFMGYLL